MVSLSTLVILCILVIGVHGHCPRLLGRGASHGAARCAYLGKKCGARDAGLVCYKYTSAYRQSWLCRAHACAFCKCHPNYWPCKKQLFFKACRFSNGEPRDRDYWGKPDPPIKSKPSTNIRSKRRPKRKYPGGCAWRARYGHVVIPTIYAKHSYPWIRRRKCLVWRPEKDSHDIDKPGKGVICYRFMVDKKSPYYFTASTRAPHTTEHNDVWVRKPYKGFRLFKVGSNKYKGWYHREWLKAYQNSGGKKYSNELKTVDFDGHQFETSVLYPGYRYSICISGRSSKFAVCKLHLVACARGACSSNRIQKILSDTRSSRCV